MAKDEQTSEQVVEQGVNKNKLFIVIGAAVAAILALVVVGFMLMGKGDVKDQARANSGSHAEEKSEGGGHGAERVTIASNIYSLEPFIVNIYDGQDLRYLKVKVELEMTGASKADIDARLAPLRDAVLVLLTAKTLQDIQDIQGKNQLKEEILVSVNKIITPVRIAKVYFTDFVIQ